MGDEKKDEKEGGFGGRSAGHAWVMKQLNRNICGVCGRPVSRNHSKAAMSFYAQKHCGFLQDMLTLSDSLN